VGGVEVETALSSDSHNLSIIVEDYYSVDDLIDVAVIASVGAEDMTVFDDDVLIGQSGGVSLIADALGEGLPAQFTASIVMPYPVSVDIDVELDGSGGHARKQYASRVTPAASHVVSTDTGDLTAANDGDELNVWFDPQHSDGDPVSGEILLSVALDIANPGPSNVTATATGPGEVTVSWEPVDGVSEYTVYRRENSLGQGNIEPVRQVLGFASTDPAAWEFGPPGELADGCAYRALPLPGDRRDT